MQRAFLLKEYESHPHGELSDITVAPERTPRSGAFEARTQRLTMQCTRCNDWGLLSSCRNWLITHTAMHDSLSPVTFPGVCPQDRNQSFSHSGGLTHLRRHCEYTTKVELYSWACQRQITLQLNLPITDERNMEMWYPDVSPGSMEHSWTFAFFGRRGR